MKFGGWKRKALPGVESRPEGAHRKVEWSRIPMEICQQDRFESGAWGRLAAQVWWG